jgi:hypothetical protein
MLFDLAILLWGLAYALDANERPAEAGRIMDLNLFGSTMPAAAFLEWIALILILIAVIILFKIHGMAGENSYRYALPCFVTLALLIGAEGIARIKAIVSPGLQGFPTNSGAIWTQRYVRWNGSGFRDGPHAILPESGTRRLLVVGDSIAFGWGLPRLEDRLGERIAAGLTMRTGATWESLNAARPNSHTLHHIGFLEQMAVYRPNVVLLIYYFNDIDYLRQVTSTDWPVGLRKYYPHWIIYSNSYLFQEVFIRLRLAYHRRRLAFYGGLSDSESDPYVDRAVVSRHVADIVRFVRIASEIPATVRLVPLEIGVISESKVRDRYRRFLQEAIRQVPICSLEHAFDGYTHGDLALNALDAHPSALAHRLASAQILDCLTAGNRQRGDESAHSLRTVGASSSHF